MDKISNINKNEDELSFQNDLNKIIIDNQKSKNDFSFDYDLESKAIEKNINYFNEDVDKKEIKELLVLMYIDENCQNDKTENIKINLNDNDSNKDEHYNECQEIMSILRKPYSNKNVRKRLNPFKPLCKPKKVSLIGKVFSDIPSDFNITQNSTQNNNFAMGISTNSLINDKK